MAEGSKVRTVAELMSAPPVTALPSETVADVATRMEELRVGSVLVVDGDRCIGILTERDLVRFAASGAEAAVTKVSEWMTAEPDVVTPGSDVVAAFASFVEHGYRHVPVVDDGVLPRDTALVVGMDASGVETVDGLRYTRFVDGITPRRVRDLGGNVAKMLWYTRPDRQDVDSRVADEIRDLVKACEAEGLLLIVELLTYQLEGETAEAEEDVAPEDREIVDQIKELLDTRVRPAVAGDGGDIVFRGYREGVVKLHMQGACSGCPSSRATLKHGIENMLRHYVPEVVAVEQVDM